MAKIYCHINQRNASVQYFAILYTDKYCTISEKPLKLKMRSINLHTLEQTSQYNATDFATKNFVARHMPNSMIVIMYLLKNTMALSDKK